MKDHSFPLVMVEWEDHSGDAGWSDKDAVKEMKIPVATIIGWLVDKDRKTYKIADTLLDDGTFGGVSNILRKTITQEWEITF